MHRQELTEALSGGYVQTYSLDLLEKSFSMHIDVLDGETSSSYDLLFDTVRRFTLEDEALSPWERLELTEIVIEHPPEESGTEEWEIWISFWDVAHLSLRCRSVLVDGRPLG